MSNGLGNAALQRTYTKVALNSVIDNHKPGTFRGHVVDRIQYFGIAAFGLAQTIGFLIADIFLTLAKYAFVGQWPSLNKVQESVSDKKWGTFYGTMYALAGAAMPHLPGQFVKDAVEATDKAPAEYVEKLTKDLKKHVEEKVAEHKKKIEGTKDPKFITEATFKADSDEVVKGFTSYANALIVGFNGISADDKYVRLKEVKAQLQEMLNGSKETVNNVKAEVSEYTPFVWSTADTKGKALIQSALQDFDRVAADALKEGKAASTDFDVEKYNTAIAELREKFEKHVTGQLTSKAYLHESFDAYKAEASKAGIKASDKQAADLKAVIVNFGNNVKRGLAAMIQGTIMKSAGITEAPKTAQRTNFGGGLFDIVAKPAAAAAA